MRSFVPYLVSCAALLPLTASALPMEGLYRVNEPYSSQLLGGRDEGLRRAFDTLILRLTGDVQAAQSPALAALRNNPQQLITQYGVQGNTLMVEFDPTSVQRSLRQAGLGMWGNERPALLTWWLNESSEGNQLVGDGQDSANVLRNAAQYRGLPLTLPLADLNEQLAVTPETLQSGNLSSLREAASRYDADALLVVDAREADGGWQATWQVALASNQQQGPAQGQVTAANSQALADAVMLAVSGYLAPQFVAKPAISQALRLEVRGANIARFAELDRLLEPMNGQLLVAEGDRLIYSLEANPEQLRNQLSMARLQEAPTGIDDTASAGAGPLLHYRW